MKAEKAKRIRELTDPDHAWDTHEEEPTPAPVAAASVDISGEHNLFFYDNIQLNACFYPKS